MHPITAKEVELTQTTPSWPTMLHLISLHNLGQCDPIQVFRWKELLYTALEDWTSNRCTSLPNSHLSRFLEFHWHQICRGCSLNGQSSEPVKLKMRQASAALFDKPGTCGAANCRQCDTKRQIRQHYSQSCWHLCISSVNNCLINTTKTTQTSIKNVGPRELQLQL